MTPNTDALRELLVRAKSIADELDEVSLERATILELSAALAAQQGAQVPTLDRESTWFALAMNAAASLEDAANCLRDPDAKKSAEGAAKHVREKAKRLSASPQAPAQPANCPACGYELAASPQRAVEPLTPAQAGALWKVGMTPHEYATEVAKALGITKEQP